MALLFLPGMGLCSLLHSGASFTDVAQLSRAIAHIKCFTSATLGAHLGGRTGAIAGDSSSRAHFRDAERQTKGEQLQPHRWDCSVGAGTDVPLCCSLGALLQPWARPFGLSGGRQGLTHSCYIVLFLKAIKWHCVIARLSGVSANRGGYLKLTITFLIPLRNAILDQVSTFELHFYGKKIRCTNSSSRELPQCARASRAESYFRCSMNENVSLVAGQI